MPSLHILKTDKKRVQIKVLSLEMCAQVLQIAKEKRLSETRSCLESRIIFNCLQIDAE